MELKEVYELWDRFEQSAVAELDLQMHGVELHLKKASQLAVQAAPAGDRGLAQTTGPDTVETDTVGPDTADKNAVKAPLIGVFYHAASPDAEPFVKEGQHVKKGDVIGIIEAMKMMNEVVCDRDGIVTKICAGNGEAVEYNEPLIEVSSNV
ncbi:MAG: acetyl-CoA carboxylase biotin carboxyl carrier protein [Agathobacter sp.]|uniref:acetyl-CoA carboxylase biotin carboxyl carrier protein n=1 Tax=Agathobacter sp. TaxID=2021311 RepID=UPI002585D3B9|nr:acetyl-CoA carboxylase biotin carboxyl carrier protein [Agathobacter sp.]MCR5677479.1 acetyl-CoA carboxylase biotin carboxyl carrier protein [Agathobacter sp.]